MLRRLFCRSDAQQPPPTYTAADPTHAADVKLNNGALQANRDKFFKTLGDGHASVNAVALLWNTPLAAELPPCSKVLLESSPRAKITFAWELSGTTHVTLNVLAATSHTTPFEVCMHGNAADGEYTWTGAGASRAVAIVLDQLRIAASLR